jgi:hypothetical protein
MLRVRLISLYMWCDTIACACIQLRVQQARNATLWQCLVFCTDIPSCTGIPSSGRWDVAPCSLDAVTNHMQHMMLQQHIMQQRSTEQKVTGT